MALWLNKEETKSCDFVIDQVFQTYMALVNPLSMVKVLRPPNWAKSQKLSNFKFKFERQSLVTLFWSRFQTKEERRHPSFVVKVWRSSLGGNNSKVMKKNSKKPNGYMEKKEKKPRLGSIKGRLGSTYQSPLAQQNSHILKVIKYFHILYPLSD